MPLQRVQLAPSPEMDTHWHIWECQVSEGIQSGVSQGSCSFDWAFLPPPWLSCVHVWMTLAEGQLTRHTSRVPAPVGSAAPPPGESLVVGLAQGTCLGEEAEINGIMLILRHSGKLRGMAGEWACGCVGGALPSSSPSPVLLS